MDVYFDSLDAPQIIRLIVELDEDHIGSRSAWISSLIKIRINGLIGGERPSYDTFPNQHHSPRTVADWILFLLLESPAGKGRLNRSKNAATLVFLSPISLS